ncbi:hypothetical protein K438DRAFT_1841513 [Mycena galopus ATCC 62051]|nr:hypothetical protein K438DRAFT_1841513 [Mycena galopus ATCC 62051]
MPVGFLVLLLRQGFVLLSAFLIRGSSTSSVFRTFDVNTVLSFSDFWRSYSLKIQNSNGFNVTVFISTRHLLLTEMCRHFSTRFASCFRLGGYPYHLILSIGPN